MDENTLLSVRDWQNVLKSLCPVKRERISRVDILGVGFRLTYPQSLFRVDEERSSPVVCSITTESDSKSVVVAMRLLYFFSTSERRNVSSGMFLLMEYQV